jgi:hypothetical protein
MIDITQAKTGDVVFIRTRFDWKKPRTYLSRLINFGINFWSGIFGKSYCPANHVGILVWFNNRLCFFESDENGFNRKEAFDYFKNITNDNVWIKRYDIDEESLRFQVLRLEGAKYAYEHLFKEVANQLTNERFEAFKNTKRLVCSQSVALAIHRTNTKLCKKPLNHDPQDLYFDNDSEFIIFR